MTPSRQTIELPPGKCELGYTKDELRPILGTRYDEFMEWMNGQTVGLCTGKLYDHDKRAYYEACGGVAHGPAFYGHDVRRFLDGLPVID